MDGSLAHRDGDIIGLLQARRHAQAFDLLLNRYETKVFRLCCSLLRNTAQAEDAAQESLVRIWKGLASYDGRAALSTWIYSVTRNRCLTAIERRRFDESLADDTVLAEVEMAGATPAADSDDRPQLLRELVDALPDKYRRCLVLYYYEEQSIDEAAHLLGIAEGTVKTNLHRARALLSQRLAKLGLDDPNQWLGGMA
jgi:RNA polymerase sigma-70 factor (ECF subfamily)